MNRIFICADTHGIMNIKKIKRLVEKKQPDKDDYIIICGDVGIGWNEEITKELIVFYESLGTNILFIDGNHENFNALKHFPIETWNGGCSHKISEHIRFLCRSQIFTIYGKTFLTLGGADSHDKENRIEGESWWKEERITKTDIDVAYKNLEKVDFKVDYVLTHTPSDIFAKNLYELFTQCGEEFPASLERKFKHNGSGKLLDDIEVNVEFKKWFCGHWHIDEKMGKHYMLFENIVEI